MQPIKVPEGMLEAANSVTTRWTDAVTGNIVLQRSDPEEIKVILEAALLWLSENPIVPEHVVYDEMYEEAVARHGADRELKVWMRMCEEWQRRMFLAPDPEVPEDVKNILWEIDAGMDLDASSVHAEEANRRILEAYRRGKESK